VHNLQAFLFEDFSKSAMRYPDGLTSLSADRQAHYDNAY